MRKLDEVGQKIRSSSHKVSKHWGCNVQHDDYSYHSLMVYFKAVKRVSPEFSSQRKNIKSTYCGYYFTIYVTQVIMLYTVNLYRAVYQLYINKIGK